MSNRKSIPEQCKTCTSLSTTGVKAGGKDKWCCKYGKATYKIIGHCKLNNGHTFKGMGEQS